MRPNKKYSYIHKIITEPCARNPGAMACIPLRECPQVRDLSMKILKHGKGATRQDLFGQIQDRLCGEKVTKDLLVCCESEKKYVQPGLHPCACFKGAFAYYLQTYICNSHLDLLFYTTMGHTL